MALGMRIGVKMKILMCSNVSQDTSFPLACSTSSSALQQRAQRSCKKPITWHHSTLSSQGESVAHNGNGVSFSIFDLEEV